MVKFKHLEQEISKVGGYTDSPEDQEAVKEIAEILNPLAIHLYEVADPDPKGEDIQRIMGLYTKALIAALKYAPIEE